MLYANLDGALEEQARTNVQAMRNTGLKRLIFVNSIGICDEVPGERFGSILDPYRKSAAVIEAFGETVELKNQTGLNPKKTCSRR